MEKDDFDWDDYINTAGMGSRLPVQATELLGGIGSQNLRSLLVAAPGDIPEEFGCSPKEAAVALACCELAELPAWDEAALIDAATVGGNEEERVMWGHESRDRLARRISLVMKAEKASEVMSPADGVLLLRRAGINVFHQLLDAVAWLQLGSDATLPNYRLLKGIAEPQKAAPATDTATPAPVDAVGALGGMELLSENKTKRNTATGPVFSMKKAAMIEQHKHEWPTIEGDMRDAATNGLSTAKAGVRDWDKTAALAWAQAKGKLKSASKPADALTQAMHSLSNLPTTRHILKG